MKGLLRGLRYFSTIFDEKEPEMEIGFPTNVKHVAHIGWDGASANNKPSWMNEFKCPPVYSNGALNSAEEVSEFEETILTGKHKHKSRRSASAAVSPINSPARKSTDGTRRSIDSVRRCGDSLLFSPRSPIELTKQSRRDRSANDLMDSPTSEGIGSPANCKSTRRQQNSGLGIGSPARDSLSIPKNSRAKKSKGLSRKSRKKDQNSSGDGLASNDFETKGSELGQGTKTTAGHLTSVLEAYEEEG